MTTRMWAAILMTIVPPCYAATPLPPAPVRIVVTDPSVFDAALTGAWRKALSGEASADDPVVAAFRQSQVGTKLEAQWGKFSGEFAWTWRDIRALKPTWLGLSLLGVGNLEAVLVVETPLAVLPSLPPGSTKSHAGIPYHLVSMGAGDPSSDPGRRMGFAWARSAGRLFVATSERGLILALTAAGNGTADPPLSGFVSVDLDLDSLRKDRYFRREFVFGAGDAQGHVRAALQVEGDHLVELREGTEAALASVYTFESAGSAAAGWEPNGDGFFDALRLGLLEPIPLVSDTPVPSLLPLPAVGTASDDTYLVNLEKPRTAPGAKPGEEAELSQWRSLLAGHPIASWGFLLGRDGSRHVVFPWPKSEDSKLLALCRATVERRAGRSTVVSAGEVQEIRVGPDLPALALKRTGEFVWMGISASQLAGLSEPKRAEDLLRWARTDLAAVRAEADRWQKAEGPANPDRIRPLSDRVLGLLGWIPKTQTISVERKKTADGWSERVVFGIGR